MTTPAVQGVPPEVREDPGRLAGPQVAHVGHLQVLGEPLLLTAVSGQSQHVLEAIRFAEGHQILPAEAGVGSTRILTLGQCRRRLPQDLVCPQAVPRLSRGRDW